MNSTFLISKILLPLKPIINPFNLWALYFVVSSILQYIIIIIPLSLSPDPFLSLLASRLDGIQCLRRADEYKFLLAG